MIRNLMALPCMLAFVLACGDGRMDDQNAGTPGSETGTLTGDTAFTGGGIGDTTVAPSAGTDDNLVGGTDTAPRSDMSAPAADTASGIRSGTGTSTENGSDTGTSTGTDTGRATAPNQDQSGVTDTETGESELGSGVDQLSPDQGQPVTSKGDTVGVGGAGIEDTTTD